MNWIWKLFGYRTCPNCRKLRQLTHMLDLPKMEVCGYCWDHWGEGGTIAETATAVQPEKAAKIPSSRIQLKPPTA